MSKAPEHLRRDYLSGEGFFGSFFFPYNEELKKSRFFLETMENFVASSEKDEVQALEKGLEGLTQEQRDEYWQWHYPIHWQEIFSNRLRASFILQLCTFVEGELSEICQRVEVIAETPIKVNDLRGSTVSKPRKYLGAFARFDRPGEESWETLERVFDVRNVMVHKSGFAGGYRNHSKIVALAAVAPGLSLHNDHIEIGREFCEYCLTSVSDFCDQLHDAYEAFRASRYALSKIEELSKV